MATAVDDENTPPEAGNVGDNTGARLFSGIKLWFSRAVPGRDWLIQNAQLNGAEVVPLEKQADILLVDHARKNQAPGTTSFRFVELSIRRGQLEDLEDHAVATSTRAQRSVGSTTIAPKRGRNAFTEAEDQFLWNIIKPYMQRGGQSKGNEIYKQVERINPRHTYQSWRARWMKITQFQNRQVTENIDLDAFSVEKEGSASLPTRIPRRRAPEAVQGEQDEQSASPKHSPNKRAREGTQERSPMRPPLLEQVQPAQRPPTAAHGGIGSTSTSPIATPLSQRSPASQSKAPSRSRSPVGFTRPFPYGFTDHEAKKLYHGTAHILGMLPQTWDDSWKGLAKSNEWPGHSAQEWKNFWETVILPKHCARRGKTLNDIVDPKYLGGTIEDDGQDEVEEGLGKDEEDEEAAGVEAVAETTPPTRTVAHDPAKNAQVEPRKVVSNPAQLTCTKCFTNESSRWRHDKEGKSLCNDCGRFLKSSGFLRPSDVRPDEVVDESDEEEIEEDEHPTEVTNAEPEAARQASKDAPPTVSTSTPGRVDVGVQTSPIIPASTPERRREKSPSLEPESPSSRPPGPNEARKRSAGRSSQSNSQDTNKSNTHQQERTLKSKAVEGHPEDERAERRRRVRLPSSEPSEAARPSRKKRRLHDDPNTLEIPPTPEHIQTQAGGFDVINAQRSFASPSPRPQGYRRQRSPPSPHSPLFVPQDSDEDNTPALMSPENRKSSPMVINLLSEDDQPKMYSSFSQHDQDDNLSEGDTASQYAFETAPDVSQDWETAPEEATNGKAEAKARLETQALFDVTAEDKGFVDEFALPAPEGGWEAIEGSPSPAVSAEAADAETSAIRSVPNKRSLRGSNDHDADSDDEDRSSEISNIDAWQSHLAHIHPPASLPATADLEAIAFAAIQATSFDFRLATRVVAKMVAAHSSTSSRSASPSKNTAVLSATARARQAAQEGGVLVPDDIPGCWTEEDDNMLFSQNARDWGRAARKHGEERCNRRFDFLEAWNRI